MRYRTFARTGWSLSEVGFGTWGMGGGPSGWRGSDEATNAAALRAALEGGCNFFDTAWIYGRGHSEKILGEALRTHLGARPVYVATKVPPKNMQWPAPRAAALGDVFPSDHVRDFARRSLDNLGTGSIDLLMFHVWQDAWAERDEWRRVVSDLKSEGIVRSWGISANTWESENVLATLRVGLIDAVEVVYNVFEQRPEDKLLPYCQAHGIAVVARVPFDEGALTGAITIDTKFDPTDWRASYFVPENLADCVPRVECLRAALDGRVSLPEFALRFVLHHPAVTTVIPGMRRVEHVKANLAAGETPSLGRDLLDLARMHRWDRLPTWWSQ